MPRTRRPSACSMPPQHRSPGCSPSSCRPVKVPPDYCTSAAALALLGAPAQGALRQPVWGRATLGEGRGLAAPAGQMNRQGWGVETWRAGGSGAPPWTEGAGPHPPARLRTHFSGALPAPTFRPAEPRAPLSLPPGGQSSRWGGVPGAGSSGGRSLGLRPRFFPPAGLFSFLGTRESGPLCLGGGSAEVRNQFWGREAAMETLGPRTLEGGRQGTWGLGTPELLGKPETALKRNQQTPQRRPLAQMKSRHPDAPALPGPLRGASASSRRPGRALTPGPSLTHLRVGLENVVLDATLGAELLGTQQTAVLPHQVVPLEGTGQSGPWRLAPTTGPWRTRSTQTQPGPPQSVWLIWMGA